MAQGRFGGTFKGWDGFGKTLEDVKVKTRAGAFLTMLSAAIIFTFTVMEFIDYRRINIEESILVDTSRGESLSVKLNITFPRVPCYLLSLDVTDISGDVHQDLSHNVLKTRLDPAGAVIHENTLNYQIANEVDRTIKARPAGYCGSCYGAEPVEGQCCQTCDSVRQAYLERGWSFDDPNGIEQCVAEHWTTYITEQNVEGCNLSGRVRIKKTSGNFHFSPGRSFLSNKGDVHDLVPYLRDGSHHDFGHEIHTFHFEGNREVEDEWRGENRGTAWRKRVGLEGHPLDGVMAYAHPDRVTAASWMFQYFMKVVSTEFAHLDGDVVRAHQYSVTNYERNLNHAATERDEHSTLTGHSFQGLPGAWFSFEVSPLMVKHAERRTTFAHFMTSICAIVGGVLTLASIADSMVFAATSEKQDDDPVLNGKAI